MRRILRDYWICFLPIVLLVMALPWDSVTQLRPSHAQTFTRIGQLSQSWDCALLAVNATMAECQAVPTNSSDRHYITDIVVWGDTATTGTFSVQSGTGTACATGTVNLFPSTTTLTDKVAAPILADSPKVLSFITPIRPTVGHAICVDGVATNTTTIQIHGFLERR